MRLDVEAHGRHAVIRLAGTIGVGEAAVALSEALSRAETEQNGAVVLDLSEVPHIDSTALGILVGSMRRLHGSGREMRLVRPRPGILLLLQLTKLDGMFPVHASVPAALATERRRSTGGMALGDRTRREL